MHIYPELLQAVPTPSRVHDQNGRTFDLIGFAHLQTGDVLAIVIPDSLLPDEPLTVIDGGHLIPEEA